jgi:P-type Ca2+ transporter type 2C
MNQTAVRRASPEDLKIVWHSLSETEVLTKLEAPPRTGLATAEVEERQRQYGLNELVEKKRTTFMQMVIGQLNNFVVILLIVAAVVSALLGDWIEAAAIMSIVVLNAILGVVQESRAEEALAALKKAGCS